MSKLSQLTKLYTRHSIWTLHICCRFNYQSFRLDTAETPTPSTKKKKKKKNRRQQAMEEEEEEDLYDVSELKEEAKLVVPTSS